MRETRFFWTLTRSFASCAKPECSLPWPRVLEMQNRKDFATRLTLTRNRQFCLALCCSSRRRSPSQRTNTGRLCLRSGRRELTLKERWGRSSTLIRANAPIRSRCVATAASTIALLATIVLGGCHHEPAVPAKPAIAVRLADVTLYQSTEGLRYSASLIPYAQIDLAFRTAGYITGVKQIRSADGRTRDFGPGDYVTRGTFVAQVRVQDLKNQAAESATPADSTVAQH